MTSRPPNVVIVGAGFGGLAAAQRLAGKPVDVTLIDRRNHHLFQPLLYQVATAALSPADIAAPIRSILARAANIRVLLDEVTGIDTMRDRVSLASGGEVEFDYLLLATGAGHSYFGNEHWAPNAPGLKSIDDAIDIRRRILLAMERAESESDREHRRGLLTFVVIGGGPTGVEMAGAIAELARRSVSGDFRSITPQCSRVILVEAGPRLLPSFPVALSDKAEHALRKLGVELILGDPVTDIQPTQLTIGERAIASRTIVWAAGVRASLAARWLEAEHDKAGRIFVDASLAVAGHHRIFAIGDTASAAGLDGHALPGIAPVAKQQGRYVADRILGRRTGPFRYRSFGNLATIGRRQAVIDWNGWHISGSFAWLIWSLAHVWFLVGFRSRLVVGIQWAWNYVTYQRSARLITGERVSTAPNLIHRKTA